jgi:hypothetical protein
MKPESSDVAAHRWREARDHSPLLFVAQPNQVGLQLKVICNALAVCIMPKVLIRDPASGSRAGLGLE